MARMCYYHQTTEAANSCAQCGVPICNNCIQLVGPVPACRNCAPALHARQQQMVASGANTGAPMQQGAYPPQGAPPQNGGYGAPPSYPQGSGYTAPSYQTAPEHGGNIALGMLAGLGIGIVGSIIVMKILFLTGFGLAYLYIGVGYGVGFGIHKFTGRGGTALAALSVVIMMIALLVGHLVFANDVLQKEIASDPTLAGISLMDVIPMIPSMFSPMHWICIAIGLYSCWRAMEQQGE